MSKCLYGFNVKLFFLLFLLIGLGKAAFCTEPAGALWDAQKYISTDEIQPGMNAYCLTVYEGTNIEKFNLETLSVVRNFRPGRDVILVKGTDDRFIYTGAVAGCSGSPVYVEGRLAGALALGWTNSKDPLYGVTPIREMLQVGTAGSPEKSAGLNINLKGPVHLSQIEEQLLNPYSRYNKNEDSLTFLPSPLIVSGLPVSVCDQLNGQFSRYGIFAVSGLAGSTAEKNNQQLNLEPGSSLAIPLVTGDIEMTAFGTATEVIGDKVYGFGHSFVGYGPVNLPMATGKVHTVVASRNRSFKLGSSLDIVGTLTADESSAIKGIVGRQPRMIPLTINIQRYNDPNSRSYNCSVAYDKTLTPMLFRSSIMGAALQRGSLPPEHTVTYRASIDIADYEPISFENVSTETGLAEIVTEIFSTLGLLMNNPFKEIDIQGVSCEIEQTDRSIMARIWSANLSDNTVEPGQKITIDVIVEQVRGRKKDYSFSFNVPDNLKPGRYKLLVTGGQGYREFLYQSAPQKFIAENAASLIEVIKRIVNIPRDRLYCILILPEGGIALERAELPDLPPTKTLLLTDATRTLKAKGFRHWLEKSVKTGNVIIDQQEIEFEVKP